MGPGILWNLREFTRRLGSGRSDFPPVAYSIQPVANVGDLSALSTPIVPPSALVGLKILSAANYATAIFRGRAQGGTLILDLSLNVAQATGVIIHLFIEPVESEPGTYTTSVSAKPQNVGPVPVLIDLDAGEDSAIPTDDELPQTSAANANPFPPIVTEIFLPPASQLRIAANAVQTTMYINALVQEWHEVIPSS